MDMHNGYHLGGMHMYWWILILFLFILVIGWAWGFRNKK